MRWVTQHIVSLLDIHEWRTVLSEVIRVILFRPAPVCGSDLAHCRRRQNAENRIVVLGHISPPESNHTSLYAPWRHWLGMFAREKKAPGREEAWHQPSFTLICRGLDFSALGRINVSTPFFDSAEILL